MEQMSQHDDKTDLLVVLAKDALESLKHMLTFGSWLTVI